MTLSLKSRPLSPALAADRYEICDRAETIHGWLTMPASRRTVDILTWQEAEGITGNVMEIGVMCGKYFSLMLDSAIRTGGRALGIDTFQFTDTARVDREMETIFGAKARESYTLWQRPSSTVSPSDITEAIGAPRFVSVDGAHDYENVLLDMELADAILSPKGIISADDFLNPLTLGVNQAINEFLSRPRRIVPVACLANKLFLCHRSMEDAYRDAIETAIRDGADIAAEDFAQRASHGRHHVEQDFHGHRVLIA